MPNKHFTCVRFALKFLLSVFCCEGVGGRSIKE